MTTDSEKDNNDNKINYKYVNYIGPLRWAFFVFLRIFSYNQTIRQSSGIIYFKSSVMSKKDYILKVLDALEPQWPIAK